MNTSYQLGSIGVSLTPILIYPHEFPAENFSSPFPRAQYVIMSKSLHLWGLSGIGIPLDARHITKEKDASFPPLAHALPPNTRVKCSKRSVAIKLTYHAPPIKYSP
jgi:hypothetical protein